MSETNNATPARPKNHIIKSAGRLLLQTLKELVVATVPAVLIALFVTVYVAQATTVKQQSMEPNLYENERMIIEKITYRFFHGPRRGDIVIFDIPGEEIPLVKRVVALPGEKITVQNGRVLINDQLLEEAWVTRHGGPNYPPTTVPPLHVFVMGDNRGYSRDSRYFGPVAIDQIIGRVCLVYWPPDQAGWVH